VTHSIAPLGRAVAAAAIVAVAASAGGAIPQTAAPALSNTGRPASAIVVVPIGSQVAGTILKVDVVASRHVAAGTVLVELNPARYRASLAQARARAAALAAQAAAVQSALATGRQAAGTAVSAAIGSANTMPPPVPPPPVIAPTPDPATAARLRQAQQQIVAARTEILNDAESEAGSAKQIVDRDRGLLAQGMIATQQLTVDQSAYNAVRSQVAAAQAALRQAHAGRLTAAGSGGIAQAQAAVAAAQAALAGAQTDAAAAGRTLDRDKALAAQGAVAVRQITADTVTADAANARAQAASAELRGAQAQLTAARTESAAAAAAQGEMEAVRRAEAVRLEHAAQTTALARRAQSTIAGAERQVRLLATLRTQAIQANGEVRLAEARFAGTVIRSPADGWVSRTVAAPGQAVKAGEPVVMLEIPASLQARHVAPNPESAPAARPDASEPKSAADTVPSVPPNWPGPRSDAPAGQAPGGDNAALAQVGANEGRILAQLEGESARIRSLSTPGGAGLPFAGWPGGDLGQSKGTVPTLANGEMPWPILGPITSGYGWRIHPIFDTPEFHTGVDIAAAWGTPVEAPAPGRVIYAGTLPANGTLVILDHGRGLTTTYSHLSSYDVRIGERVERGQVIAQVGSTGWSTGPHLFFEIRQNGRPIDPLSR
jgi:murein DD-endopeptidase MepM/ murein hydrolase activator NlpD